MSSLAHTATGPASIRMPLAATASMRLDTAWLKKAIAPLRHVYVYSTMFASIAGFIFGYDTGSIGPITVMPQFEAVFHPISPTLHGLIVSSILLTAAVASFAAGPLSNSLSRTRTAALGGGIFALGSALQAGASTLPMLLIGRCIAGVGEGFFFSVVTIYVTEISPAKLRGRLSGCMQLLVTMGVAAGFFTAYGTVNVQGSIAWRLPFIIQACVSSIFGVGCLFLPHSPRWLHHVGRDADAIAAARALGIPAVQSINVNDPAVEARKDDSVPARLEIAEAPTLAVKKSWVQAAGELFAKDARRATFLGCFLSGMQQLSGIDGILYYAPVLFTQAGLTSREAAFLASGVTGLVTIAVTIPAQLCADKWGRRASTISGGLLLGTTMTLIGVLYASRAAESSAGARYTIIALIYLFVIIFSMTWALVIRTVSSEIQPVQTRASATALAQGANWAMNWCVAFTTPLFLARSSSGPYFLFGGCSLLTALVSFVMQPESKGVPLGQVANRDLPIKEYWGKIVGFRGF